MHDHSYFYYNVYFSLYIYFSFLHFTMFQNSQRYLFLSISSSHRFFDCTASSSSNLFCLFYLRLADSKLWALLVVVVVDVVVVIVFILFHRQYFVVVKSSHITRTQVSKSSEAIEREWAKKWRFSFFSSVSVSSVRSSRNSNLISSHANIM